MTSVRHTAGDVLTSGSIPTASGDWTIRCWIKANAYSDGAIVEFGDAVNQGIGFSVDSFFAAGAITAYVYNSGGSDDTQILTGSSSAWVVGYLRHAAGSANYTISYGVIASGAVSLTHVTLSVGSQISPNVIIVGGSPFGGGHADCSTRRFVVSSSLLSDADVLADAQSLALAGTELVELDLDSPTSAGDNTGTGTDYTVSGTLQTDATEPDFTVPLISHVASQAQSSLSATTSSTTTIPACNVDDVLIFPVVNRDSTAAPTVTDNDTGGNAWARIDSGDDGLTGWWKRATSGTGGKTITASGATGSIAASVSVFRDCLASGTPFENVSKESNASANESHAAITPTADDSHIVLIVANRTNDTLDPTTFTATNPTTLAERVEVRNTGGSDCSVTVASASQNGTAGSTGALNWAQTNAASISLAFNLLPATGGLVSTGVGIGVCRAAAFGPPSAMHQRTGVAGGQGILGGIASSSSASERTGVGAVQTATIGRPSPRATGIGMAALASALVGRAHPVFDGVWEGFAQAILIGQARRASTRTGIAVARASVLGRRAPLRDGVGVAVASLAAVGARSPVSSPAGVSLVSLGAVALHVLRADGRGAGVGQVALVGIPAALVIGEAFGVSHGGVTMLGAPAARVTAVGVLVASEAQLAAARPLFQRTGVAPGQGVVVAVGFVSTSGTGLGVGLGAVVALGRRELVAVGRGVVPGSATALGAARSVVQRHGLAVLASVLTGRPAAVVSRSGVVLAASHLVAAGEMSGIGEGVGVSVGYGAAIGRREMRSVGQGVMPSQAALVARSQAIITRDGVAVVQAFGAGGAIAYSLVVGQGVGLSGAYLIGIFGEPVYIPAGEQHRLSLRYHPRKAQLLAIDETIAVIELQRDKRIDLDFDARGWLTGEALLASFTPVVDAAVPVTYEPAIIIQGRDAKLWATVAADAKRGDYIAAVDLADDEGRTGRVYFQLNVR